jgi:hypothetical protein
MAPIAICITPFSGPSQRKGESYTNERHIAPMSESSASASFPRIIGATALIAATSTSLPRPMVKTKPLPVSWASESVTSSTYAAE